MKDDSCQSGWIVKATTASVTVQQYKQPPVTVKKEDVLWVDAVYGGAHEVLYSARSSWQDVIDAKPLSSESLQVVLKDGTRYKVKSPKVTANGIMFAQHGQNLNLPKSQVETVDYVRQKPITDGQVYLLQEAWPVMLFDPRTWFHMLGMVPELSVRIYDASRPEDDPLPKCPFKQLPHP
jgi:hypothetical protein